MSMKIFILLVCTFFPGHAEMQAVPTVSKLAQLRISNFKLQQALNAVEELSGHESMLPIQDQPSKLQEKFERDVGTSTDCWSACTSACEKSEQRTPTGSRQGCPAKAPDCTPGEGTCVECVSVSGFGEKLCDGIYDPMVGNSVRYRHRTWHDRYLFFQPPHILCIDDKYVTNAYFTTTDSGNLPGTGGVYNTGSTWAVAPNAKIKNVACRKRNIGERRGRSFLKSGRFKPADSATKHTVRVFIPELGDKKLEDFDVSYSFTIDRFNKSQPFYGAHIENSKLLHVHSKLEKDKCGDKYSYEFEVMIESLEHPRTWGRNAYVTYVLTFNENDDYLPVCVRSDV